MADRYRRNWIKKIIFFSGFYKKQIKEFLLFWYFGNVYNHKKAHTQSFFDQNHWGKKSISITNHCIFCCIIESIQYLIP